MTDQVQKSVAAARAWRLDASPEQAATNGQVSEILTGTMATMTEDVCLIGFACGHLSATRSAAAEIAGLRAALEKCRRGHEDYDGDVYHSCPRSDRYLIGPDMTQPCDCGADAWNARIDAALAETEKR